MYEFGLLLEIFHPVLDRVKRGHGHTILGLSYLCEESLHTKSKPPTMLRSGLKVPDRWWMWVVGGV